MHLKIREIAGYPVICFENKTKSEKSSGGPVSETSVAVVFGLKKVETKNRETVFLRK